MVIILLFVFLLINIPSPFFPTSVLFQGKILLTMLIVSFKVPGFVFFVIYIAPWFVNLITTFQFWVHSLWVPLSLPSLEPSVLTLVGQFVAIHAMIPCYSITVMYIKYMYKIASIVLTFLPYPHPPPSCFFTLIVFCWQQSLPVFIWWCLWQYCRR